MPPYGLNKHCVRFSFSLLCRLSRSSDKLSCSLVAANHRSSECLCWNCQRCNRPVSWNFTARVPPSSCFQNENVRRYVSNVIRKYVCTHVCLVGRRKKDVPNVNDDDNFNWTGLMRNTDFFSGIPRYWIHAQPAMSRHMKIVRKFNVSWRMRCTTALRPID